MAEDSLEQLGRRFPRVRQAYQAMVRAVEGDAPLNDKTRQLVLVAVAAALGQREALAHHRDAARKAGASDAEVEHAVALALPLAGLAAVAAAVGPGSASAASQPEPAQAPAPAPKKTKIEEGDWVTIKEGQGGLFIKAGQRGQVTKIVKGKASGLTLYYVKCVDVPQEEKFVLDDLALASPDSPAAAPLAAAKDRLEAGDWVVITHGGLLLKLGERGQIARVEQGPMNITFYYLRKPGMDAEEKYMRTDFEPAPGP